MDEQETPISCWIFDPYITGDYIENLKNKIQMEQLTHITLLSPETAKHLQVEYLEMVLMVVLMVILLEMRMMLMVSPCTGPGPVQDLGHELHQVHRRPREGDHQDRPH